MRNLAAGVGALALALVPATVSGQGMAADQIKQILGLTKANWIAFRDWEGQELIYFTHLEAWKCGIDYVFYGFNGGPLDQLWELDKCDPANPNAVLKDKPYLSVPPGTARTVSVQLVYPDGTKSDIETFTYTPGQ